LRIYAAPFPKKSQVFELVYLSCDRDQVSIKKATAFNQNFMATLLDSKYIGDIYIIHYSHLWRISFIHNSRYIITSVSYEAEGQTGGQTDGWMAGWMDGWMDGDGRAGRQMVRDRDRLINCRFRILGEM
jgi:hypothetical protein